MTMILGTVHVNSAKAMLKGAVVKREEEVRVVSAKNKKARETDMKKTLCTHQRALNQNLTHLDFNLTIAEGSLQIELEATEGVRELLVEIIDEGLFQTQT